MRLYELIEIINQTNEGWKSAVAGGLAGAYGGAALGGALGGPIGAGIGAVASGIGGAMIGKDFNSNAKLKTYWKQRQHDYVPAHALKHFDTVISYVKKEEFRKANQYITNKIFTKGFFSVDDIPEIGNLLNKIMQSIGKLALSNSEFDDDEDLTKVLPKFVEEQKNKVIQAIEVLKTKLPKEPFNEFYDMPKNFVKFHSEFDVSQSFKDLTPIDLEQLSDFIESENNHVKQAPKVEPVKQQPKPQPKPQSQRQEPAKPQPKSQPKAEPVKQQPKPQSTGRFAFNPLGR